MKKWTDKIDWGNSMIYALKCAGLKNITLFKYPKSDTDYGYFVEADGMSEWIGYTKKNVYDFAKKKEHENNWIWIVKNYRSNYENSHTWHGYLMEFYYPPKRIK